MKYQIYRLLIVLLMCISFADQLFAQYTLSGTPFITNFSTQDFGGGIQTWYITQSSDEIIYVANNFGVLEYDGSSWQVHRLKNTTKVRSVLATSDGRIYAGAQGDFGFFEADNSGQLHYTSVADSLERKFRNFDEVWRIYQHDQHVYFFTFKNIFKYTPATHQLQVITSEDPLEYSFYVNRQVYSLVRGKGLSILRNDKLELLPEGGFFKQIQISAIVPYDKSQILIFTYRDGIYIYDGLKLRPFDLQNGDQIEKSIINNVLLLKDGRYAVGTQNDGLFIINAAGEILQHISKEKGLIDRTVLCMFQDKYENLWLGLNNGISMVELNSPFTTIDEKLGLPGAGYAASSTADSYFLGTNNGAYQLNKKEKNISSIENTLGQVYSFGVIENDLLIGHHNGPMILKNKEAQLISDVQGAWTFAQVPGHPEKLILGTYQGLSLMEKINGRWQYRYHFEGFDESSRVLEFDENGQLWMAHGYKGIYKIQFDPNYQQIEKVDFYNSEKGFPSDLLIGMEKIRNELLFPAETGIYTYDTKTDRFVLDERYAKIFSPSENIIKIKEDVLGNIYFMSNQRIGVLRFDNFGQATLTTDIFNKIQKYLNDDLANISIIDPKNILFGAKEGFIHYDPDKKKELKSFQTHIRRITNTSNGDSILYYGKVDPIPADFHYAENSLRFGFSATFYEDPKATQYQWILENFDKDWSEWTATTEKEYTNLPEGSYTFKVRSKNIYGTLSNVASFEFIVRPPFYRSKFAYLFYTVGGLILFGMAYFYLDKRFNKEKKMIMLKQERVLNQKDTEIKQITNKSEEAIMRLSNEKLQSEIEHKNKELTSSTIHLINKNELLSSVKSRLEDMVKRNYSGKDELKRLIKEMEQNISSDKDWNQFETHFNTVHGDFTHRLLEKYPQLTPQEIKLSAYLRLNLNTKEIAHLLNISVRGVEISRYRLRKKLDLDRNDNLTDFMLRF